MSVANAAVIIIGASGDLARRKLVPALARLWQRGELRPPFVVVGAGRSAFDDLSFRARFDIPPDFARFLHYHRGIRGLRATVAAHGQFERIVVFAALPPSAYADTARELAADGFGADTSLVIEKPFGYDYASAADLNRRLAQYFDEERIYRIDHYLAKEPVQNILVFRFANSLFYPVWNSRYVRTIEINACESEGVGNRGAYFDRAGIIRDMVQNHLTQLLCLLTMEAPVTLNPEDIRAQKIAVLKALRVAEVVRGQYEGYRHEPNVAPDSTTETYAELKLFIDTFRWTGIPIHIRVGKKLHRKGTDIAFVFRPVPRLLFNRDGTLPPNRIVFKIQPAEGIILDLSTKVPGGDMRITGTTMTFCYRDAFRDEIPEAYQRLLLDVLRGDRTLFVSAEETEISWRVYEPFLDKGDLRIYPPGVLPSPVLHRDWTDFESYGSLCA